MSDPIQTLTQEAETAVQAAQRTADLDAVETKYLGRKGSLNELRRTIGTLPAEERPAFGARINEAVTALTARLEARRAELEAAELDARLASETLDVTLPGRPLPAGRLHPLTQTAQRVKEVLSGLGFAFVDGPELEDYRYNFASLNYPEDHPAMDEQNSFFVTDTRLLRTQTTALQGRVMAERRPPFRIATIGRCFRYEAVDATHHHTFHQIDVFMVDEHISMADLKGTLGAFARAMFGPETLVRFRPDFFPFVEPGVDYAIAWKGRWLELGGAGLIHPNILRAHGIDTERYSGFAFGLGIERIHMIQTGVNDLRLYLENDLRFLRQF
ncbi:MAG TPA: phenylalanine--tRNA ligase subunit alpha [Chthonomonadaceae bacterium]|nr:phenylalanine--tRNA ligase subunit alpha [Chthonomonadaceae bacterium]